LRRPPAAPGGGVISVNTASDRPEKPSHNRAPRMSTSQPRPMAVAPSARTVAMAFRRRRPLYRDCTCSAMVSPDPALDAQQQVAGDRKKDESDEKQDAPERDGRGGINVAARLGEFVGDRGRNRRARREYSRRDPMRIADDESHRHSL